MSDRLLTLCALLWARPGREHRLIEYERAVLAVLPDHGARVICRFVNVAAEPTHPLEVQILAFPSEAAFEGYLADPRRKALGHERDAVVARTSVFPVEPTGAQPSMPRESDASAAALGEPGDA